MAFPNSFWTDVLSTTLFSRQKELADNVTNNIPFLNYLKKRGNTKIEGGGVSLVEEIQYSGNSTYQRYSGYEALSVNQSQVISAAEYAWKQAAIAVVASGKELRQNMGDEQILNLLKSRTDNAVAEFGNNMAVDVFSDGTADAGKQVGGIQLLVADDPTTGTVGGISRVSFPFWRNVVIDASGDPAGAVTATNVMQYFNRIRMLTARNNDCIDIIVADQNYYGAYWSALQAIQRITSPESGAAGFGELANYGPGGVKPVMYDPQTPTDHAYFLNTKYAKYRVHSDANMTPTKEKAAVDQDSVAVHILWMGNLTMSSAERHGVLKA